MEKDFSGSQLVIYGANGWLGRSALASATNGDSLNRFEGILLIGSKESLLDLDGKTYKIHTASTALEKIRHGAVFFNSAFLRREYLQRIDEVEYISKNNQISRFALDVLSRFNLSCFINVSSGIASKNILDTANSDPYAQLKSLWENRFEERSRSCSISFLNCRIFSMTGRFINEFDNLAISTFIKSAMDGSVIKVNSPRTRRTYLDSEQLSDVLLNLGKRGISSNLDSGGVLVSMSELAQTVVDVVGSGTVEIAQVDQQSDYYGDYRYFNSIANSIGIEMAPLRKQVEKTLLAFS